MAITQLLPTRIRVALHAAKNDARHAVQAIRRTRIRGSWKPDGSSGREYFVPSDSAPREPRVASPADVDEPRSGRVSFAEFGIEVEVEPGQTILQAGLQAGVDLTYSCTLGGCGACMLRVRDGQVFYDDPDAICLTEDEVAEGMCLACVGRPDGRVVLEEV